MTLRFPRHQRNPPASPTSSNQRPALPGTKADRTERSEIVAKTPSQPWDAESGLDHSARRALTGEIPHHASRRPRSTERRPLFELRAPSYCPSFAYKCRRGAVPCGGRLLRTSSSSSSTRQSGIARCFVQPPRSNRAVLCCASSSVITLSPRAYERPL